MSSHRKETSQARGGGRLASRRQSATIFMRGNEGEAREMYGKRFVFQAATVLYDALRHSGCAVL